MRMLRPFVVLIVVLVVCLPGWGMAEVEDVGMDVRGGTDTIMWRKPRTRAMRRVDSVLSVRYNRQKFDTAYIIRPPQRLTLKARVNMSTFSVEARRKRDGIRSVTKMHTDHRATLSLGAVYRGIGVGLSLNPLKWSGRNRDFEFNVSSYGNRFGGEIAFQSSKTLHGDFTTQGNSSTISRGQVSMNSLNLNLYYVFNYRKFSFPAAFSQSYIQRRSVGSWMLGVSAEGAMVKISGNDIMGVNNGRLSIVELGIGGGYGYNLVSRRWLFHISSVPTIMIYTHDKMKINGEREHMRYQFPSAIITGRGSVVYTHHNRFYGASCVYNFSVVGDDSFLQLRRNKWLLRLFAGVRL